MDLSNQVALSYYKTIATLNEAHKVYLVQHRETNQIYVKKILEVYNRDIYQQLWRNPILGTPRIIDLFEEDHKLIVIESFISGHSLQDILEHSILHPDFVYPLLTELCDILDALHSLNPPVIHRDVKPSNILITEYNHVILLDFNAAKFYTGDNQSDTMLLGTKGYAAPEQYGFGSSTPKTDIYALGILMRELNSHLPLESKQLNQIIETCIQMNPDDRYSSVKEIKNALTNNASSKKNTSQVQKIHPFLPPGFRTGQPWKMFVAFFSYLLLIYLCLTLNVENTYGIALWLNRLICFLMFVSWIFICFNYQDIQRFFPLCKSRYRLIRYLGNILFCSAVTFLLIFLLNILVGLFS